MDAQQRPTGQLTRRDAMRLTMKAGVGLVSFASAGVGIASLAHAQGGAPPVLTPPADGRFPQPPSWPTELRQLAPNVYAYIQAGGPRVGKGRFAGGRGISNAGVIAGGDHLMVIDTLGQPLHTQAFIAAIRQTFGNTPVGRVVNTHQHSDHVNGNHFFMPAEIVGHSFCRKTVLEMAAALPPGAKFERIEGAANGDELQKLVAPTTTFTDRITYQYSGTVVELMHLGPGHTWGDVVVYLPQHKILFAGDDACFHTTPFTHQGHVSKWMEAIDKIIAMDVDIIVPGHGPTGGKKEMADVGEYFRVLKGEVRRRYDAKMTPGRAAAEIRMGKFDNWIGAERVLLNTCRLYDEFNGTLTPQLDVPGMTRAADEFNVLIKAMGPTR